MTIPYIKTVNKDDIDLDRPFAASVKFISPPPPAPVNGFNYPTIDTIKQIMKEVKDGR